MERLCAQRGRGAVQQVRNFEAPTARGYPAFAALIRRSGRYANGSAVNARMGTLSGDLRDIWSDGAVVIAFSTGFPSVKVRVSAG